MRTNLLPIHEILDSNKIRRTPLRILCLQSIMRFKEPFTVGHLVSSLRWQTKINVTVARRTLRLYEECGLLSTTEKINPSSRSNARQTMNTKKYRWNGANAPA